MMRTLRIVAVLLVSAAGAVWLLRGHDRAPERRPATRPAPAGPAVYRTEPPIEPDTCVAAWLLTRIVSPGSRAIVGGEAPGSIPFDVPRPPYMRTQSQSVSRLIVERHSITDPLAVSLMKVAQELEMMPWTTNADVFFNRVRDGLAEAVNASPSEQVCLNQALAFLDALQDGRATSRPVSTSPSGAARGSAEERLHNVLEFGPGLFSGSAPAGQAAFDELQNLGIKTIICVDAAMPDVASAQARGMRYVHLPIAYGGIAENQGLRIARAVRDLSRPVYIHCHKGVHRGPAAAAFASVCLGWQTPERAVELMHKAGTAPKYAGLYATVSKARALDAGTLGEIAPEFPAQARTSGLAAAMAEIDRSWEHIALIHDAGWRTPSDHPDLDPINEARIIAQAFDQLTGDAVIHASSQELATELSRARQTASKLVRSLEAGQRDAANEGYNNMNKRCQDCHARFRDRQ